MSARPRGLGEGLAGAFAVGMTGLGVVACVAPGPISGLYGVPQADAYGRAWVRAAGLRDLALAGAIGALLADRSPRAAGVVCVVSGCVAIADAANVLATRGPRPIPHAVHLSGVGVGLLAGLALLRRR